MASHGFTSVELAPSKLFAGGPLEATDGQIRAVRAFWGSRGIDIAAMQALLYGHPELTLFQSTDARLRTQDYLSYLIALGARLGARALVFGAPRQRARGRVPHDVAFRIAVEFFGGLSRAAEREGTCLCIEPVAEKAGCDFVVNGAEALQLVDAVNSPAFGLHLDTSAALLAGESLPDNLRAGQKRLKHVHISEPDLDPVRPGGTADVPTLLSTLREIDYGGAVSIEMRGDDLGGNLDRIAVALQHVKA